MIHSGYSYRRYEIVSGLLSSSMTLCTELTRWGLCPWLLAPSLILCWRWVDNISEALCLGSPFCFIDLFTCFLPVRAIAIMLNLELNSLLLCSWYRAYSLGSLRLLYSQNKLLVFYLEGCWTCASYFIIFQRTGNIDSPCSWMWSLFITSLSICFMKRFCFLHACFLFY